MIDFRTLCLLFALGVTPLYSQEPAEAESAPAKVDYYGPDGALDKKEIPEMLSKWSDWVLEGSPSVQTPRRHSDGEGRLPLWVSRLEIDARGDGAGFVILVESFGENWLTLPGGGRQWPDEVQIDGKPVPVVERGQRPAIRLTEGDFEITGRFGWSELPQQMSLPPSAGLLTLKVEGKTRPAPSWDADGTLWLQREASTEQVDEDFMSIKVHSLLEDGIPLWFETRIELIVAGKSREEALGSVLPEGWQLAKIESPIPVAIDEKGFLKAQLRAGRWSILLRAFQTSEAKEVGFAADAKPAVEDQALVYRAQPDFRQAEVMGMAQIDVAQTQVPEAWRSLPVYRWETNSPFQVVERIRGPGQRGAAPLTIQRSLWLDDDGKNLTYQDRLSGELRRIRRLDAAEAHHLGSVTVGGEPQLITHNPEGGASGFEVRAPQLDAVATGRIEMQQSLSATGWKSDAGNLKATLQLSPGYRLFALFGADYTKGDWLTSWTLLDLFLLLLFSLAVFRLRGIRGALLALVAFGLAYHEPGSPRFPWLLLLIPVALIEVVPANRWRKWVVMMKWGAAAILLISLAPFLMYQIQGAIFPQLERKAAFSATSNPTGYVQSVRNEIQAVPSVMSRADSSGGGAKKSSYKLKKSNLKADPKAVIQTGPGVPMWSWRTVEFGFDGPVDESQTVRPILIPPAASRGIGVVRVLALVLLAALLFCRRKKGSKNSDGPKTNSLSSKGSAAVVLIVGMTMVSGFQKAEAQFPEAELLDQLRTRLTETPSEFPGAVEIANAKMNLDGEQVSLEIEFHAATRAAAPVPFPLAAMEPKSAAFDSGNEATLLREEGRLWVLLPEAGIHRLVVKGILRARNDWEWDFALKPRHIAVAAPGWTVSGIRPDRSAEDQVLFARAREAGGDSAAANYDHPRTNHAILVERQIELGLVWRVTTTVSRLSPKGRAVALQVPLLTGEKVVSAGRLVKKGAIEVRLAPSIDSVTWEGELTPAAEFTLTTPKGANWTERWRLVASSVWNVSFDGLSPVFVNFEEQLVPLWQPWPGESATITVSRPKAVEGAAVTIDSAKHTLKPGRRQRSSVLELSVRTSLGEDFPIQLPAGSEVSSLLHDNKSIPIRKEGDAVVVPLRPGPQQIKVEWRASGDLKGWTRADAVVLPVESANLTTLVRPSRDRWLILTEGPLRGPAVRFWAVLAFAIIAAVALSRASRSPLGIVSWGLLMLGLTQISVVCSLIIVAWLFVILWQDEKLWKKLSPWKHNIAQVGLIILTLIVIGFFVKIASVGLLGNPEMYVAGNGSSATYLNWFSARAPSDLPQPGYWSISIWWFRLAMLLWALWLSYSLVRWLRKGWQNSAKRGHFRSAPKKKSSPKSSGKEGTPPELPKGDSA